MSKQFEQNEIKNKNLHNKVDVYMSGPVLSKIGDMPEDFLKFQYPYK